LVKGNKIDEIAPPLTKYIDVLKILRIKNKERML